MKSGEYSFMYFPTISGVSRSGSTDINIGCILGKFLSLSTINKQKKKINIICRIRIIEDKKNKRTYYIYSFHHFF